MFSKFIWQHCLVTGTTSRGNPGQAVMVIYNHGQNIWQKCHITPLPPISMLLAQINMFLRKDLIENSNIDVGGGTNVLKIFDKVDIEQYLGK